MGYGGESGWVMTLVGRVTCVEEEDTEKGKVQGVRDK